MIRAVRGGFKASSSLAARCLSTVQENTIRLVLVDREGNRATVSARIGQTLLDACFLHKVDIEGPCGGGGSPVEVHRTPIWTESTFGEGPTCFLCHVQIPSKYNHLLPPVGEHEAAGLEEVWEEEKVKSSRLACQITLDRKHDGMVVYIPDSSPADLM